MKSGPTLKPCTRCPRRTSAARIASVTVVLPEPECVPAMIRAGMGMGDPSSVVPGLAEQVRVGPVVEVALGGGRVVEHGADEDEGGAGDPGVGHPPGDVGEGTAEEGLVGPTDAVGDRDGGVGPVVRQ